MIVQGTPERIERVMALSEREFVKSLSAVLPTGVALDGGRVVIPLRTGQVTITYEALPSTRLGRSLELPRTRVILTFTSTGQSDRDAFLARFDIAFQRGGG